MSNLEPLEFKECVVDSPCFREKLFLHEREINNNVKIFKNICNSIKNVYRTLEECSVAFEELAENLMKFTSNEDSGVTGINKTQFETEDEKMIRCSVKMYSDMIKNVEILRKRDILGNSKEQVMNDLKQLGEECLSRSKENIKEFKRTTTAYYTKLDKYSAIKYRQDAEFDSIDEDFKNDRVQFVGKALRHVMNIQDTEEKRTSKLVHTLGLMMQMFATYHHEAYDHLEDEIKKIGEIEDYVYRTMENYTSINTDTTRLMKKLLNVPIEHIQPDPEIDGEVRREGYLFVLTKKHLVPDMWIRKYCVYEKNSKKLSITINISPKQIEDYEVISCEGKMVNSSERRFCFDLKVSNQNTPLTLQALSKEDLKMWLQIMDGKEPKYVAAYCPGKSKELQSQINGKAIKMMSMCYSVIENRGIDDEGLYRLPGKKLDRDALLQRIINDINDSCHDSISLQDLEAAEVNTLTSTVKVFISCLKVPLATYKLYDRFVAIGKIENRQDRFNPLLELLKELPPDHFQMLSLLMKHLKRVTQHEQHNLMSAQNLAVCFSPTIFQTENSVSVSEIISSKFAADVLSVLIERCDELFKHLPTNTNTVALQVSKSMRVTNLEKGDTKVLTAINKSFRGVPSTTFDVLPRNTSVTDNPQSDSSTDLDHTRVVIDDIMEQLKVLSSMTDLKTMCQVSQQLSQLFGECENHQREMAAILLEVGFPDYAVRIMRKLNNMGVFKNDDIWYSYYYFYDICWNYTSVSFEFASSLAQRALPSLLVLNITFKQYLEKLHSSNVEFIVKASLNIIRNMCRYPGNCTYFRAESVKTALLFLINRKEDLIQVVASLCLSFLVIENDTCLFGGHGDNSVTAGEDVMLNMIRYVRSARDSERKKFRGFRSYEFMEAIRSATSVECEREHFIDVDGLGLVKEILVASENVTNEELIECLEILTNICSSEKLSSKPLEAGITDNIIGSFLTSDNLRLKTAAQNYLWRVELNKQLPVEIEPIDVNQLFVYISYASIDLPIVKKLKDRLVDTGLINISDPEDRSDTDSVKKTIRRCAIVIICVSEAFKSQPRYQLEVEYCDRISRSIVPILIQQKYRPDGWLQRLLDRGMNLFNLSSRIDFDASWETLKSSLSIQLKEIKKKQRNRDRNEHEPISTKVDGNSISMSSTETLRTLTYESVDYEHSICSWLARHGLGHLSQQLAWLDMTLLKYFQNIKTNAQDYFYQILERKLNLDLIDILKFSNAIDNL